MRPEFEGDLHGDECAASGAGLDDHDRLRVSCASAQRLAGCGEDLLVVHRVVVTACVLSVRT
jgi:hypothetical protein